jgi:hypothetical protein
MGVEPEGITRELGNKEILVSSTFEVSVGWAQRSVPTQMIVVAVVFLK